MQQRTESSSMRSLRRCCIPRPAGTDGIYKMMQALEAANELGYPVLVRPSYVLGGQGMQIAISDKDISRVHGYHQQTLPRSTQYL